MLTRSQVPILQFDPEIQRTEWRLRQEARRARMVEEEAQVDTKTLLDYLAPVDQTVKSAIRVPVLQANNFALRYL